jgi:Sigma-70 region 2
MRPGGILSSSRNKSAPVAVLMRRVAKRSDRARRISPPIHFDERQSMTVVSHPRRDAFRAHERAGGRDEIRGAHTDDEDDPPAGDANARFSNLVLPHLGDAYSLARWITGSRADAEDVIQDAFLRAFRAIGGFAGINARPWLLTIVRNTAYTWLRKNRPSAILAVEDLEGVEAAQTNLGDPERTTPETELIAKADAASLEDRGPACGLSRDHDPARRARTVVSRNR